MKTATFSAVVLFAAVAVAQVPTKIGYQGLLLKSDGTPETGTRSITFTVFDAPSAGTSLWSSTQTILLTDGFYATQLGPLPLQVFGGPERYLEISVGTEVLTPRMALASVPYALKAGGVTGGIVDATSVLINGVEVIGASGLTTAALTGGRGLTVDAGVVSLPRCNDGEILKYSTVAAQWGCATFATDAGFAAYSATPGGGLDLNGTGFSLSRSCAAGQSLTWNGTAWVCDAHVGGVTATSPLRATTAAGTVNVALQGPVGVALGGTGADLSTAAGGFVRQAAAGGVLSVAPLAVGDLPSHSHSAASITGVMGAAQGGTGVASCGINDVLRWSTAGWACATVTTNPGTVTAVSATAPLVVANGTSAPALSINTAGAGQAGALSAIDWAAFNAKVSSIAATAPLVAVNGTSTPALSINTAGAGQAGALSAADWAAFNAKVSSIAATSPLLVTGTATSPTIELGALPASAIPGGSGNYIQNQATATQAANFNIAGQGSMSALGIGTTSPGANLDVAGNWSGALSGTVTAGAASQNMSGNGTRFLSEVQLGDLVRVYDRGGCTGGVGYYHRVIGVSSDTALLVDVAWPVTVSGTGCGLQRLRPDARFRSTGVGTVQLDPFLTTTWGVVWSHFEPGWGANGGRPFLAKQWDGILLDFLYLGATSNQSNTTQEALMLASGQGFSVGRGSDDGRTLSAMHLYVNTVGNVFARGCYYPAWNGVYGGSAGAGYGTCASDERLKKNIVAWEPMLERIARLQPVDFEWRDVKREGTPSPTTGASYGFVAQQVEQVMPELVVTQADGYKAVKYDRLPIVAIEGIKELKRNADGRDVKLRELERRAATLERENAELKRRLSAIERRLR